MKNRGFSLIDCLVGLGLSLFILLAGLEFYGAARDHFFLIKEKEEAGQSVLAGLDKIRIDLLRAGQDLVQPMLKGVLEAVAETTDGLLLVRAERTSALAGDAAAGTVRVSLTATGDLKPGREICIFDDVRGEIRTIAGVEPGAVILASPLDFAYSADKGTAAPLERIRYVFDAASGTLRRRVNSASAQPLAEGLRSAEFRFDRAANLVRVRLEHRSLEGFIHELSVFPKNPGLSAAR